MGVRDDGAYLTFERIATATQAKTLAWGLSARPIDWIAAMGMAQVHGDPLPTQVARLMAGDHRTFWDVCGTLERKTARKQRLTPAIRLEIFSALYWWTIPACHDCVAGHRQIADTPMLEDERCATCLGTGLRPHLHDTDLYARTLAYLDAAAAECGAVVRAKVA